MAWAHAVTATTTLSAPVRCPICDGHGHVAPGFYDDPNETLCRACQGSGIVR